MENINLDIENKGIGDSDIAGGTLDLAGTSASKVILVTKLNCELINGQRKAVELLKALLADVDLKKKLILDNIDTIKDKHDDKVWREEYEAVNRLLNLFAIDLEKVSKAVEFEIFVGNIFLENNNDKIGRIVVKVNDSDSFEEYIAHRIQLTKILVKKISKVLAISNSRITVLFQNLEKKIYAFESGVLYITEIK